ncbi:MAG TPA: ABC transporter permease [Chryseolinea sp.]
MLKNYFKIALRSFQKHKGYAVLNLLGLTVGLTSALLVFLFAYDEFTYDHYHSKAENIYRLNGAYHLPNNGAFEEYAAAGPVVGEMLVKDFPEIKQVVRIRRISDKVVETPGSENRVYEPVFAADSNLFRVFTYQFLQGNPDKALLDLQSIVITRKIAMKYFDRVDVVGESLFFPEDTAAYKISAVIENFPSNTHLKMDIITSFETLRTLGYTFDSWWNYSFYSYLELGDNVDPQALTEKIKFISRKYIADQEDNSGYRQEYSLTNVKDIHLYSNLRSEIEPNSKAAYAYTFLIVGIFIVLIACINFMNLATARSAIRAKEVGVRKVSGAFRSQLIGQFLSESIMMVMFSTLLSIGLAVAFIPQLNNLTGKLLSTAILGNPVLWLLLFGLSLFVGLLAGSYPSFFLSMIRPVETLKGNFRSSSSGNLLRKTLVVFQFTISIILISGTIIVYRHLDFMRSINLGFEKAKTIVIPSRFAAHSDSDFKVLKEELKNVQGVTAASLSSRVPGKEMGNNVVRLGWDEKAPWSDMRFLALDHDFVSLYDLDVIAGRSFDESFPSDAEEAFMLNESGMRRLGWKDPQQAIGQKLAWQDRKGYVIGIIKDFHFMSANIAVEPFIMIMNKPWSIGYLSLKLTAGDPSETLDRIRDKFNAVLPDRIFEYYFLDEEYDKQYKAEDRFMNVFTLFGGIAIFIACLGLYGLAMFTAEQKFKEIGIRKVLGASAFSLVYLQVRSFVILVLVAFAISVPLAYVFMDRWLQSFPLRERIEPAVFLASGLISIIIAWITVSYQSIKAANVNPVKSIAQQ